MPRYFLQLSFNGAKFHGWQIQENAHSVQADLNKSLTTLLKSPIETVGCGRTDTGVHAKKFFVHFDCDAIEIPGGFLYHLNRILPFEIAVQNLFEVAMDAHARFDATSRTYQYLIHQQKNPFLNESSYFFPYPLDMELLQQGAQLLRNYSDFGCFSKSRTQVKTNICKIMSAEWRQTEDQLIFEITADRFLRNMVRAIVGTLLDIGEKRVTIEQLKEVIANGNRSDAGTSVPGHALFLTDVTYPFIFPFPHSLP